MKCQYCGKIDCVPFEIYAMKKPKHGGKRKGAGRPKLPPELKKEATKTMRISISKIPDILKAIGKD